MKDDQNYALNADFCVCERQLCSCTITGKGFVWVIKLSEVIVGLHFESMCPLLDMFIIYIVSVSC